MICWSRKEYRFYLYIDNGIIACITTINYSKISKCCTLLRQGLYKTKSCFIFNKLLYVDHKKVTMFLIVA